MAPNLILRRVAASERTHEGCRLSRPGLLVALAGPILLAAGLTIRLWAPLFPSSSDPGPAVAWLLVLAGLAWSAWALGWWWQSTPRGIVVTGRNVTSLSVLQAVAWAVFLVSLLLAVAATSGDLGPEGGDALSFDSPLGGIGAQAGAVALTSGVAVGLTAAKKRRDPTPKALASLAKADVARRPAHHAGRLADAVETGAGPSVLGGARKADAKDLARTQARLVLGRLDKVARAPAPAADVAARPTRSAERAADRALAVQDALVDMVADGADVRGLTQTLLEGRVPEDWAELQDAYGLPGIEDTREAVKRLVQGSAMAQIGQERVGSVFRNACACQARFTDMLEGDEVADHESKDSSKVQFLVVTFGTLVAMLFWAWHEMDAGSFAAAGLPGLPSGLTALSAATAAGYLGGKVPQRTDVEGIHR